MSNYLIVGKVPPPLGGVTVYVERSVNKLESDGHEVKVVSPFKLHGVLFSMHRADHIHIHTISLVYMFMFMVMRCLHKVTVFDHNHSRHFKSYNKAKKVLIPFFLNRIKRIKVANVGLSGNYSGITCDISVFCPFIPPVLSQRTSIINTYPIEIQKAIQQGDKLVVTSAWMNVQESDENVYGLDAFVDVADIAYKTNSSAVFIIMLGVKSEYDDDLIVRASKLPNLLVLIGQYESWPLLERASCFIRNTSTDGDSVSVREAMFFNTPVLASDRAPRPNGVTLFTKDDQNQIFKLVKNILKG